MVGRQRRAQRATGIAGRRLDPHALEAAIAQDFGIGHAIQRHAASHAEIAGAGLRRQVACQPQHDVIEHGLRGGGDIEIAAASNGRFRLARRTAKEAVELPVGHAHPHWILEVIQVEPE